MRVVLFGATNRGTQVLKKLIELKEELVGVFYFKEDTHETIWYEKIQDVAKKNNIKAYNIRILTEFGIKEILEVMKPDVIFVVSWRYKIDKELHSIPPQGCIVFHDSLLPEYRGFAPMNWAIINGERKTGVTMFYIADEIDSGDIIAQNAVFIEPEDDARTLNDKLTDVYIRMLEFHLPLIRDGKAFGMKQDHQLATYTCKRKPSDGLIDWNKSALQIHNLIRGLTYPYPGAYSYTRIDLNKTIVRIWKSRVDTQGKKYIGCIPGRVLESVKGVGMKVLTGDGILILEEISVGKSKKHIQAGDLYRSVKDTFESSMS